MATARTNFNLSSFNAKCMGLGVVERYFNIYLFQSSSPSLCLCLGVSRARGYKSCGNFGRLLEITVGVIHDSKRNRITALDASSVLRRWITFHLRETFMADWEIEVLDADRSTFGTSPASGIEIRETQLKTLQDTEPNALIDSSVRRIRLNVYSLE
jgi:hypothetical protein